MAQQLRALLVGTLLVLAAAAAWADTPPLMNYTMVLEGSDEARLVNRAQLGALQATVGQLLFANRILVAENLLEAYLERNMQRFVSGVTVLERVVDRGGYRLRVDVGVFASELERALVEYRFLIEPRRIPLSFVFLSETLDGTRQSVPVARPIVQAALDDAGLQVSDIAILSPDSRIDVAEGGTDPETNETLAEALVNAERGGVELLFTGQATTTLTSNPGLYYEEFHFYETTLLLRMFRVDTGEMFDEIVVTDSGAHPDDSTARDIAIRKCINAAVGSLMETHRARWPREVLNETDYQLMFTDVGEGDLALLRDKLANLPGGAETFLHTLHGGVATLNLTYSSPFGRSDRQERQELVEYLRAMDSPQLRVETVEGSRIVARVLQPNAPR